MRLAPQPLRLTLLVLLGVAACSPVAVVPVQWLRLSADAPMLPAPDGSRAAAAAAAPAPASAGAGEVWQLVLPVALPAHLERDTLFVPQAGVPGGGAVQPLAGARWIEPLRDAVPRVLREDIARSLHARNGAPVLWRSPLPPGLVPTRQLRVEITAFEIGSGARAVVTHARWSIADARGERPPQVHEARFDTAPAALPADAADWAAAHRQAIAALAERIAATMASPSP
ncbi:MAG: membrane integrity-associated transporter subunit PqiC [Rubrivivax sp.]|nr:membrane integrity-associated transporter subunit PqiC [Rubrivivax sp.]